MNTIGNEPPSLADVVETVRRQIERARRKGRSVGEENTKAAFVEPVLSALGWDVRDVDEVSREYKRKPKDNPVDYALFLSGSPCLFVEAKELNLDLGQRKSISQTLGYATIAGVKWCVLTNGDEYRLYNAHAPVDVEQKLFRLIRISDTTKLDYTLDTLDLLSKEKMKEKMLDVRWRDGSADQKMKAALEDLVREADRRLVRLLRKKVDGLLPMDIRNSLIRANLAVDFSIGPRPDRPQKETYPGQGGARSTDTNAETRRGTIKALVLHLLQEGKHTEQEITRRVCEQFVSPERPREQLSRAVKYYKSVLFSQKYGMKELRAKKLHKNGNGVLSIVDAPTPGARGAKTTTEKEQAEGRVYTQHAKRVGLRPRVLEMLKEGKYTRNDIVRVSQMEFGHKDKQRARNQVSAYLSNLFRGKYASKELQGKKLHEDKNGVLSIVPISEKGKENRWGDCTVGELRKALKERGFSMGPKATKSELIQTLKAVEESDSVVLWDELSKRSVK